MRIVIAIVVILILVIVGLMLFVVSSLDSIVEEGIERIGSEVAGTAVTVESVSISLQEGRGSVTGVRVANPAGYPSGDAFSLQQASLTIDLASLTQDVIVLEDVTVEGPVVNYIRDPSGKANFDVIMENLQKSDGRGSSSDTESQGEEARFKIRHFAFREGKATAVVDGMLDKGVEADLPPLELNDLGGASGATGSEIGQTILSEYVRSVVKQVTRSGLEKFLDDKLKGSAGEKVKGLLDKVFK